MSTVLTSPIADRLASRARGVRQSYIRAVTRWIEEAGGVNLGQGTCPLQPHPDVTAAAALAMERGKNAYAPFDAEGGTEIGRLDSASAG